MFDLSDKTRKRYDENQKSMTDQLKGKKVKYKDIITLNTDGTIKENIYTIVKYFPNEFRYFQCGYMNARLRIKSEDGKYKTVNIEKMSFIE